MLCLRAGNIFKEKRSSCKKKELHVNSTSTTLPRKIKILIETLTMSIYPKIT